MLGSGSSPHVPGVVARDNVDAVAVGDPRSPAEHVARPLEAHGGGLVAFRVAAARGERHEDDVGAAQRQGAAGLGELRVVAAACVRVSSCCATSGRRGAPGWGGVGRD